MNGFIQGNVSEKTKESLKTLVCDFTGLSELDYCNAQLDVGIEYLETFMPVLGTAIPTKEAWIQCLTSTSAFWKWWIRRWEQRDARFLEGTPDCLPKGNRLHLYYMYHDVRELTQDCKMHGRLLDESYSIMMHRLIKKEVQNDG